MRKASLGHRILFYICMAIIALVSVNIVMHLFIAGVQIMLFGFRMFLLPVIFLAAIYLGWHFRKFWK